MKGIKAIKCSIKIGDLWKSPILHILITREDEVYVARCLDFTVSSHGDSLKEALEAVKISIIEYVRHAFENNITDQIVDPAPDRYWILFKELELREERVKIKKSASCPEIATLLQTQQVLEEMTVYA
ncbi:MAG: hypothetical protein QME81_13680 [bacterium]|nr:hypothetical protein [bacterium]